MTKRKFLPYELNWLKKYNFDLNKLDSIGEAPVEYVTGHSEFHGHNFLVNSSTLIPRIETEEILALSTSFLSSLPGEVMVADVGTGSGCIGISLAASLIKRHQHNFKFYLSDISQEALIIARKNSANILKENSNKINFLVSDLLDQYPSTSQFDLIISNLPYIPTSRIPKLDLSVKNYEPLSALDGGTDGTDLINKLLSTITHHLKPRSMVILEIDSTHKIDMFSIPQNTISRIVSDSFGNSRFLVLTQMQ